MRLTCLLALVAACGYPEPADVDRCFGTGTLIPCFGTTPSEIEKLPVFINTDSSPLCQDSLDMPACVIAAGSIEIPAGLVVRAVGTLPLVLVATKEIRVDGILDVSSRLGAPQTGAGGNPSGCETNEPPLLPGGGAGGSFGGRGGAGGDTVGFAGGVPSMRRPFLLGGCPGQKGGDGGGVAYLIAGEAITIRSSGTINASGAGGDGGAAGSFGGGGGGSGGLIWLEAPQVDAAGELRATGGGGGGGADGSFGGMPGSDPDGITPALGGTAPSPAGKGGPGGTLDMGEAGQSGASNCGGGGGGGGAGVIRVVPLQSVTGSHAPAPT